MSRDPTQPHNPKGSSDGAIGQTVGNAAILKKKGRLSDDIGFFDAASHWSESSNRVGRAWLKTGVEVGLS